MVLFINTLSLTASVNDWLVNSDYPRILHVFDKVCNLINEHGDVLSIVTQQIGNGPFNLVIDDKVSFSEYLNVESPISIHDNKLILGDLTINCAGAKLWSPRPDWGKLHVHRNIVRIQVASLRIANYQPFLSDSELSNFSTALVKVDISSVENITSQLAGLGPGLTPAGDDFILGAVFAAWIIHPYEIATLLVKEITNTAAPLTTSLSAAWLRSAGKGDAGILWHHFFDALISHDHIQIIRAMDRILATGETSGADALAGFIGSFVTWYKAAHQHG
jgi:hypothetical protein